MRVVSCGQFLVFIARSIRTIIQVLYTFSILRLRPPLPLHPHPHPRHLHLRRCHRLHYYSHHHHRIRWDFLRHYLPIQTFHHFPHHHLNRRPLHSQLPPDSYSTFSPPSAPSDSSLSPSLWVSHHPPTPLPLYQNPGNHPHHHVPPHTPSQPSPIPPPPPPPPPPWQLSPTFSPSATHSN